MNKLLHLIRNGYLSKAFWVICLIVSIYYCWIVYVEFRDQKPMVTYEFVNDQKIKLPYMQFCPNQWMDERKVEKWNVSIKLLEYLTAGFFGFNNYKRGRSLKSELRYIDKRNVEYEKFIAEYPNFDYRDFFNDIAIDKVAPKCTFEEEKIDCDRILHRVLTPSGMCWALNTSVLSDQVLPGPAAGLQIVTRLLNKHEPKVVHNQGFDDGAHLNVDGEWAPSLHSPIFIPRQTRAYITLDTTRYISVGDYCSNKSALEHFPHYSRAGCTYECFMRKTKGAMFTRSSNETITTKHTIAELCNCTIFTHGALGLTQSDFCTPSQFIRCVRPLAVKGLRNDTCAMHCKQKCDRYEIVATVSYAHNDAWRIKNYNKKFKSTWNPNRGSTLYIYHSKIGYKKFTQDYAISFDVLLSNFGGQLGLWIGICIIDLFYLADWIIAKIIDRCCPEKEKENGEEEKRVHVSPPNNNNSTASDNVMKCVL